MGDLASDELVTRRAGKLPVIGILYGTMPCDRPIMLYRPWGKIKLGAANQERFPAAETLPGTNAYRRLTPRYLIGAATSTPGAGAAGFNLC